MINNCETFDQLKTAISSIGIVNNGVIPGKSRDFNAKKMSSSIDIIRYRKNNNEQYMFKYYMLLTREFGIRQQAIYLHEYGER